MTKYRLNIKYPIEKDQAGYFLRLHKYHLAELISFKKNDSSENYDWIKHIDCADNEHVGCPKSWVEEIKKDDFQEWIKESKKMWSYDHEMDFKKCWQASEKNTHELYWPLIDYLKEHRTQYGLHLSLNDILKKIDKALKGNGND